MLLVDWQAEREAGMQESAQATGGRGPITRVRWGIVGMCFLGTTINYVDRTNLAVAAPFIGDELKLGSFQLGLILSGFFWTYAVGQLLSGYLVDRYGARIMYTFSAVWWSIFTTATAVAQGFASLFGFRLLLGIGESPAYPSNVKATGEWFPKQERGLATGIYDSGSRAGTAAAAPIVAGLIALIGWRGSFVVTGLVGLVWALGWVLFYRRPREHPRVSEAEVEYIEAGQDRGEPEESLPRIRWIDLLSYRAVWGMILGNFCIGFVIYWFVTWFPSYLIDARGFDLLQVGIYGALPALVAIPTGWLGGYVADRLVSRGVSVTIARKGCIAGGLIVSLVAALSLLTPSAIGAIALLSLSYGSLTFANASVWSLPADLAPTQGHTASLAGLMNFAGNAAGIAVSTSVGALLALTGGSYVLPLLSAFGFSILGILVYLFVIRNIAPLEARPTPQASGA
jgi:ACS family D-galactonate transporter-like MFS transporter